MRRTSLPFLATLLAAAGCAGEEAPPPGVDFGLPHCGFECSPTGPLAAGSVDTLELSPEEPGAVDFTSVTLVSDTPDVLAIGRYLPRGDNDAARAVVTAGAAGVATVSATDASGALLGLTTIEVRDADHLAVIGTPFGAPGQTMRIASVDGLGPQFIVAPETEVLITAVPYAGDTPLQGVLDLDVDIGDLALTEDEDLARGSFRAIVPAGDHDVTMTPPDGGAAITRFRLTGEATN